MQGRTRETEHPLAAAPCAVDLRSCDTASFPRGVEMPAPKAAMPSSPAESSPSRAAFAAQTRTPASRVLAITALLWLSAGCATQGSSVDPPPGVADLAAAGVNRSLSETDLPPPDTEHRPRSIDRKSVNADRKASSAAVQPTAGTVDDTTVERLLAQAEDAYDGARWGQALESFKAVTTFDPDNSQAWLRIGNLHQRRGQLLAAASAYRKAGSAARGEARLKALVNLASVNLELAGAALESARALAGGAKDATASTRDLLGAELAAQADALARFSRQQPWAGARNPGTSAPGGREREPDRRSGRDRGAEADRSADRGTDRSTDRSTDRGTDRSAAQSADRDAPGDPPTRGQARKSAPGQPAIEYLRGAPRP